MEAHGSTKKLLADLAAEVEVVVAVVEECLGAAWPDDARGPSEQPAQASARQISINEMLDGRQTFCTPKASHLLDPNKLGDR